MSRFRRLFRPALLALLAIGVGTLFLYRELQDLPNLPQVKFWEPALGSELLDRNGVFIFEYAVEKRDYVPLAAVPKHIIDAIIAIEDNQFFTHWGINPLAIIRAMLVNFKEGRVVQGGSTLTQQLAKNLFTTRRRHLKRKLRELLFTLYIERHLSKNEILEMYINQVYLGHGIYGISEGARGFFGKRVEDVNLNEAAMLAGLIKAPALYSPRRHPKAARRRTSLVLERMREEGFISENVYQRAWGQEVPVSTEATRALPAAHAHFIEYIRQNIEERYSAELLWKGGLRIETTIDKNYQDLAYGAMIRALAEFDGAREAWERSRQNQIPVSTQSLTMVEGAFLALETKSGGVLTWLGGRDFRSSQFNRVYQSKRQPGSAFKPFVWLAALESGATPATLYDDLPVAYTYDRRNWRLIPGSTDFYEIAKATAGLPAELVWAPDNFDGKYLGPVTLRRALALSRNLVSVRLVDAVGPGRVVGAAQRAGIKQPLEPVLSLGLGTSEVTLLDLTHAYATIANLGIDAQPYAITRITQLSSGEVLEENNPQLAVAFAPVAPYILVEMMKEVVRSGTARGAVGRQIEHPLAGKTGTTQDNRDLWFVGFTPEVTAGGWMGYDNFDSFGRRNMTAGATVARWWAQIMKEILKDYPKRDFGPPPDGVVFHKVCSVSGALARPSCSRVHLEVFKRGTQPKEFCRLDSHEREPLYRPSPGTFEPSEPDEEAPQAPAPGGATAPPTTSERGANDEMEND